MLDVAQLIRIAVSEPGQFEDIVGEFSVGLIDPLIFEAQEDRSPPAPHLHIIAPTAAELSIGGLAVADPEVDDDRQLPQGLALPAGPIPRA